MSERKSYQPQLAAIAVMAMLSACAQPMHSAPAPLAASNPPPVAPGPSAIWYHVAFGSDSTVIDATAQNVVASVITYLQQNPNADATIIGKTDTVGSQQYNMHLSHQRADTVRDALVYGGKIAASRVETRWTGEGGNQAVSTGTNIADANNRVVDIAIH